MIKNIVITGIGGQGVLFLSGLVRKAAALKFGAVFGYDNRGGAQRLGHVCSVIRFDTRAEGKSMAIDFPDGACDLLLALEASEALKFNGKISGRTLAVLDEFMIPPTNVRRANKDYFKKDDISRHFTATAGKLVMRPFRIMAEERFGNPLDANLVALGAALSVPESALEPDDFRGIVGREEMKKMIFGFEGGFLK